MTQPNHLLAEPSPLRQWMSWAVTASPAANRSLFRRLTESYADELYRCDEFHQKDWRFVRFERRDLWWYDLDFRHQVTLAHIPLFQYLCCGFCHLVYPALLVGTRAEIIRFGIAPQPQRLRLVAGGVSYPPLPEPLKASHSIWLGSMTPPAIEQICHRVAPARSLSLVR